MSVEAPDDKEALINERIAKIRLNNEKIARRHQEIQEDMKNADIISASATVSANSKQPITTTVKPKERAVRIPKQPVNSRPQTDENERITSRSYSNFAEGEGPPPDPGYRFLADDERDEPRTEPRRQKRQSSHSRELNKQQPQRNIKEESWRAERAAIDAERIERQRTREGNWRREWDTEKIQTETENKLHWRQQGSSRFTGKYEGSWRHDSGNGSFKKQEQFYPNTLIFNRKKETPVNLDSEARDGSPKHISAAPTTFSTKYVEHDISDQSERNLGNDRQRNDMYLRREPTKSRNGQRTENQMSARLQVNKTQEQEQKKDSSYYSGTEKKFDEKNEESWDDVTDEEN